MMSTLLSIILFIVLAIYPFVFSGVSLSILEQIKQSFCTELYIWIVILLLIFSVLLSFLNKTSFQKKWQKTVSLFILLIVYLSYFVMPIIKIKEATILIIIGIGYFAAILICEAFSFIKIKIKKIPE